MTIMDQNVGRVQEFVCEDYLVLVSCKQAIQALFYQSFLIPSPDICFPEFTVEFFFAIKRTCDPPKTLAEICYLRRKPVTYPDIHSFPSVGYL
jgi:hypothetical protein